MRNNWQEIKIGDYLKVARGGSPRPIKSYITEADSGINWIKIGDTIEFSKYIHSTAQKIKPSGLKKTRQVYKGDLLLSNSMSYGRPYILKIDGAIHDGWLVISNKKSINIDKEFLFYVFSSPIVFNQFSQLAKGSTVKNLNTNLVESVHIPLAPLPEQRAIVAKIEELFSDLDHGIECLKTAKQQLEVYRQAVLKKAFEGGLTKEWRKINNIDFQWKNKQIGEVGKWIGGGTPSKRNKEYWENGNVPWVSPKDMKTNIISNTKDKITRESIENSSAKLINRDSVLFVVRSGILRRTLPIAIAGTDLTVNQDLKSISPYDNLTFKYLYWYLVANEQSIRVKCAKDGTTVNSLNVPKLKEYPISIPTIDEQHQIVQEIESRLSVCDNILSTIENSLEKVEALRQSILKKAFAGKLLTEAELQVCRQEADWAPAEELLKKIKDEQPVA